MKTKKWIHLSSLCLIFTLTVACGGSNTSGGDDGSKNALSQSSSSVLAPSVDNYGKAETLKILNRVKDWANKEEKGRVLSTFFTRGQVLDQTTSQNCSQGTFLKFFQYEVCKGSSLTNQQVQFAAEPTHTCTTAQNDGKTVLVKSSKSYQLPINQWGQCTLGKGVKYEKRNNTELMNALNLKEGQLYGAAYDRYNSNVAYLLVGSANQGPSKLYVINMEYHSMYNPIAIQDLQSGVTTKTLFLR